MFINQIALFNFTTFKSQMFKCIVDSNLQYELYNNPLIHLFYLICLFFIQVLLQYIIVYSFCKSFPMAYRAISNKRKKKYVLILNDELK